MKIDLPKKYNHKEIEKKCQEFWQENQTYKWDESLPRAENFVIDTPPPTVSGLLHMGHIFSYTQTDFIARYQRMKGKNVFYPMGFDDNGLPTERLVEKVKKIRASKLPREEFIKQCKIVVAEAEIEFEKLFNSIALSVDWSQKYQTISDHCQKMSQLSFLDLYQKNKVERKLEPILWCCEDRTALSQADLEEKEVDSQENYIDFTVIDEAGNEVDKIEIMTTRPEMLPACVAVMVPINQNHKYGKFGGKMDENGNFEGKFFAISPIFGVKVPIIADNLELVKEDKGTGAVMCCTFGDETDILWWKENKLPLRAIIEASGKMSFISDIMDNKYLMFVSYYKDKINSKQPIEFIETDSNKTINIKNCQNIENFAQKYKDLIEDKKVSQSRKDIIQYLRENNLLKKTVPIKQIVKVAERSGKPIEIIVSNQWFIKILDQKAELLKKADECSWYPNHMKIRLQQWIEGLSWDWCISRQRFFGVQFPIWYDKKTGDIITTHASQLPVDPNVDLPKDKNGDILINPTTQKPYSKEELEPETDIMDTWATSSITPQLSSHAINDKFGIDQDRHQKLFPADIRPQAHEIIRSWAFYTMVKSLLHENKAPWKNLIISGWCLAPDKSKMSKSKGNVITPNSLIEEKGSDAIRYWAANSQLGADTAYNENLVKVGNKLINKLYNASKFVAGNFENLTNKPTNLTQDIKKITENADLWIISKLQKTIKNSSLVFDKFEYSKARSIIEDFFWNDFCDNYLELIKIRSYGLSANKLENIELIQAKKEEIIQKQQSAILTLYHCLFDIIRLFAPFVCHVTEELYQQIFDKNDSIHQKGNWPKFAENLINEEKEKIAQNSLEIIAEVRKYKSDNNLSMKSEIPQIIIQTNVDLEDIKEDLLNVTNCLEIIFKKAEKLSVNIRH